MDERVKVNPCRQIGRAVTIRQIDVESGGGCAVFLGRV